ncbi:Cytoplasmic FMR1-interacting protein 1 [Phytophthora cinnamomi]|uniref:Cytoplasmic FMR1-interacting protein 1 n=1 Tax=Phytophthora cinnamomi TaxID=4785 RepID=UPI00355A9674|nr:Cytoplasmic FMR1-interacting protein 1 [Phytophthora cinnamomi]
MASMELGSGGSALGALRAFAASCCPPNERKTGGGCCADALALAASPPPASEEFAHEEAAAFVFTDEMRTVRQLQSKCEEGRALVNAIYCCRSCARAFPPGVVADEADPSKMRQYHHAIFTVLQPQVEKIKQLSEYCAQAVVLLSDNIQRTTVHENMTRVIPDVMMDALVDIMDVILQLNHLHDTKSSLRNDFTVFKRVFLHVKDDLPDAEAVEKDIARLQEFMGSSYQAKGAVWDSLRHNLTNVKRYEQVTYLLLRHCVNHVENDTCTTPSSRFKYIRALSYLMAVLEGSVVWKKTNSLPGADKKVIEAVRKASSWEAHRSIPRNPYAS